MFDLETADKFYEEILEENPKFNDILAKEWRQLMPMQFAKRMYCERLGKHIVYPEQYEEALQYIKGQNGEKPKIWSVEEAERIMRNFVSNFNDEEFYKYDALLWLNIKRNDYPKITDPEEIGYITYQDLIDKDYPTDPSERAFDWVMKHIDEKRQK